jgi:hypothetical protein
MGVDGGCQAPAAVPPEKDPAPIAYKAEGAPKGSLDGSGKSCPYQNLIPEPLVSHCANYTIPLTKMCV